MAKLYTQIINHCGQCPAQIMDINKTRWLCARHLCATICWDDNYGDEPDDIPYPPIPSWCDLPDMKETLS